MGFSGTASAACTRAWARPAGGTSRCLRRAGWDRWRSTVIERLVAWEGEFRAAADARGPARRDGFQPRVEIHALRSIDAMGAEDRGFPAAETVGAHRHRDGHIDADHAGL